VVDSRLDRWAEVLAGLPEQTMTVVCGHTHMPFTRLAHRRQIINPGSVGMPYGRAGAHWALLADGGRLRPDVGRSGHQTVGPSSTGDRPWRSPRKKPPT